MCDCEDNKAISGKGKKPSIKAANGYADGNVGKNVQEMGKNLLWDGCTRMAGTVTGYVAGSVIEDKVEMMRENPGVSGFVNIGTGALIKKFAISDKDANGYFDNVANGLITFGCVRVFRALGKGFSDKWGIKGAQIGRFAPNMPQFKRAA
jgi:hypothetical protein